MSIDRIVCRLLRHVCRESSDPAAPELCREYLGEAARVFQEGVAEATELARMCADTLGLIAVGDVVYLRDNLAGLVVDSAAQLARRVYDAFFPGLEPGVLARREVHGEAPFDPVAALNAVIAAWLARRFDGVFAAYTPCPYRPDALHNPLVVDGSLPDDFRGGTVHHGGCLVKRGKPLPGSVEPGTAVYDGSAVKVYMRGIGLVELGVDELLRALGAGGRHGA